METLMDADPGLRRRFSLVLELEDYSPAELALICEKTAQERFKLSFAPGLREAVAQRIRTHHSDEIKIANGGLAVTLAERAFRRLATRLGAAFADSLGIGGAATVLLPEDFGILPGGGDGPVGIAERLRRSGDEDSGKRNSNISRRGP